MSKEATVICVFTAEGSTSKMARAHAWQVSAGCGQGTFIFSLSRTLHRAEYLHDVEAGTSQSIWFKEELMQKPHCLLWPSLRSTCCHFFLMVLVTQTSPETLRDEAMHSVSTRRQIVGNRLRRLPWKHWRKAFRRPPILSVYWIWSNIQ